MKLYKRLYMAAALSLTVLCLSNCTRHDLTANVRPNTVPSREEADPVIKSVEFYGWSGEGENRKHIKLDKWEEISKSNISHPISFNVVCEVEYKGNLAIQEADYIALTSLDFLIAPDNQPPSDLSHIKTRIGTVNDVKMELVPYLKSKETARIIFKDFDLTEEIKRFNEEDDILWAWAVKVNIYILNRDMALVTQGQAVLPLIPANDKSRAK